MYRDPSRRGPLWVAAPVSRHDRTATEAAIQQVVDRYRITCVVLAAISILIAAALALVTRVHVDPEGTGPDAVAIAALLISARLWGWGRRLPRITDSFGTTALLCLAGTSCGAIAMLGLRFHMPMADSVLVTADKMLRFDALVMIRWTIEQGQWLFDVMAAAYNGAIPMLVFSMVAMALLGDRLEAWRTAFTFIGCLLSTCVVAVLTPAKGLGMWTPAELIARLPHGSMRYFWGSFDAFYLGAKPVLRLDTIDGVISFPSFHAAMGFITAAMWRRYAVMFVLSAIWMTTMLLATIPYGGHYFVDLLGGFLIWAAWFWASKRIERATVSSHSASIDGDEIGA